MITTPTTHETDAPPDAVDTVESVKLDDVTGGWWYPPYGPGAYGPYAYAPYSPRYAYAPYSPRYAAAMDNRWWASHAPVPGYSPYWRPW